MFWFLSRALERLISFGFWVPTQCNDNRKRLHCSVVIIDMHTYFLIMWYVLWWFNSSHIMFCIFLIFFVGGQLWCASASTGNLPLSTLVHWQIHFVRLLLVHTLIVDCLVIVWCRSFRPLFPLLNVTVDSAVQLWVLVALQSVCTLKGR